jgi:hypothetical protein
MVGTRGTLGEGQGGSDVGVDEGYCRYDDVDGDDVRF